MKVGRSLESLKTELDRQADSKRDFGCDTRAIEAVPHMLQGDRMGFDGIALGITNIGAFPTTDIADGQLSSRLKIPKKYYDRMSADSPELLCTNINHWFNAEPEVRQIRTLDGQARAFLSNKFRPLDNVELCKAVLPSIEEAGAEILSCEVTDRRLYIKAVAYELQGEVKTGDVVSAGLAISNSEVGHGSLSITPWLYREICKNGMRVASYGKKKYHTGSKINTDGVDLENSWELYSDKTKMVSDQAFWMQVRDLTQSLMSQATFDWILNEIRPTTEREIEGDPMMVVERTQRKFKFNDDETTQITRHFLSEPAGNPLTQWGLANAITRTAEDMKSYDRASELEGVGWDVVEMPKRDWTTLSAL